MKLTGTLVAIAMGAVVLTSCENSESAASKEIVLQNQQDSISYFMGLNTGKQLKESFAMETMDENIVAAGVLAGFSDDSAALMTIEEGGQMAQAYYQDIQAAKQKEQYGDAEANNAKYLTDIATKEGVTATGTGLLYEVVELGSGAMPAATENVTVHYTGKLIDGSVFDSSVERGEPASFALNQVIPGWTEGLQLMPMGSKFTFYIPYYLAYGEQGRGETIPPYATLIFEVELIKIGA